MTSFYELTEPTKWAEPPETYSFSSLQEIEDCPRRWQLLRSAWGDLPRFPQRPHPKAIEGLLVHEAIERLVRALGTRGMPRIGSPGFRDALQTIDFWGFFAREAARRNQALAKHPRFGPNYVLRTPPRELANRAIRMFREQYIPLNEPERRSLVIDEKTNVRRPDFGRLLQSRGGLAEVRIQHPDLPVVGVIDLVRLVEGEVEVVDFKTGQAKDAHERQVMLYGVLWWRATGEAPARICLQYLGERRSWAVTADQLVVAERAMERSIDEAGTALKEKPAIPRPGPSCRFCPSRARCDPGWESFLMSRGRRESGIADLEVIVDSQPSTTGFVGQSSSGEVSIVYESAVGALLPRIEMGERLRIVDGLVQEKGKTIEIRAWTEVYPQRDQTGGNRQRKRAAE